jgi:tetratricopeptide (TPR) repeat protein
VPRLRATQPDLPAALEAIVRRCLAPDPDHRYATAGELAADLQAVADDLPLRFAREPTPSRAYRWFRRNRLPLAIAATVVVLIAGATVGFFKRRINEEIRNYSRLAEVVSFIESGKSSADSGDYAKAMIEFEWADRLASGEPPNRRELPPDPRRLREEVRHRILPQNGEVLNFAELRGKAREQWNLAKEKKKARDDFEALLSAAEPLRFRLIGFGGDLASASSELQQVLGRFYVLSDQEDWTKRPEVALLGDNSMRRRLVDEVNQLLFLWVVALERSGRWEARDVALRVCDRVLVAAEPPGPWLALRDRLEARRGQPAPIANGPPNPSAEGSHLACFQWGMLRELERDPNNAIVWLNRAVQLKPEDYWYVYYLAFSEDLAAQAFEGQGRSHAAAMLREDALEHYKTALALRPRSPWVRFSHARFERMRGNWSLAIEELQQSLSDFHATPGAASDLTFERNVGLERGLIDQSLGDLPGARAAYEAVIARGSRGPLGRAARLNKAKLDADTGLVDRARSEYESLLAEDPMDVPARLGRALLALRLGQAGEAEADLTVLIEQHGPAAPAELRAYRARARLTLRRLAEAESDAAAAFRAAPSPSRERLWVLTLLMRGRAGEQPLDQPDEVALLPVPSTVVREAVDRLRTAANGSDGAALGARLTRAVLLSALGDPGAESEASRAVALAPLSERAYLVRARVRRRAGAARAALDDLEHAYALDPRDPRLFELRGQIEVELGDARAGLADFDRALFLGAEGAIHVGRANAWLALGRAAQAAAEWTRALQHDPEDPRAYLGRARAFLRLRKWDQALADLEQAAGWAGDNAGLYLQIALAYARCLPERPGRLPRVLSLARRACLASLAALPARPA